MVWQAKKDKITGSDTVMLYEHHEIHGGNRYSITFNNSTTNTNEMSVIGFNTPVTGPKMHITIVASATAVATLSLVENPSIDNDEGTEVTIYNHNRSSSNTSLTRSIETTPVAGKVTTYNEAQAAAANITTTSTLFSEQIGASGNPISRSGGNGSGRDEWILALNTQYAIILNADSDDDNVHTLRIDWYEHTDE